jgi:predicted nucleotidyltransferase
MMKSLAEIKAILAEHKAELAEKYAVAEIGVFGSVVRGEARDDSDVDLLVAFNKPIGLIKFIGLEFLLQDLLGVPKVDLVTRNALKPYIGQYILREVQYV